MRGTAQDFQACWAKRDGVFSHCENVNRARGQPKPGPLIAASYEGEQITIHEGACVVLLQPLSTLRETPASERVTAREALRRLQSQPRLTAAQAEGYFHEVRAERIADGQRRSQ